MVKKIYRAKNKVELLHKGGKLIKWVTSKKLMGKRFKIMSLLGI